MKIISGGQTGVDQIGLEVALELGIPTGGTAPRGYKTETGTDPIFLRDKCGLQQHDSSDYPPRTEMNVLNSDITFLFGNVDSVGSKLTIALCKKNRKYCLKNPSVELMKKAIGRDKEFRVFNIAGNRASKMTYDEMLEIHNKLKEAFTI